MLDKMYRSQIQVDEKIAILDKKNLFKIFCSVSVNKRAWQIQTHDLPSTSTVL